MAQNIEEEIRNQQIKNVTGSAVTFRAIDGVGPKTAKKVKGTIIEGEGRVTAPRDVADLTADELADKAGISESRARKVIKGGGGNPDREPRGSTGSVEAGGLADALDTQTQEAGEQVEQRRTVFEDLVALGDELPDRRERRRGNFGPLDDEDPERVRELGRAAETFQTATRDPIDPTAEQQTFGFDPDEDRERASQVSVAATRFLEEREGLDFDTARSEVESGTPDFDTVTETVRDLFGGGQSGGMGGGFLRGPARPTDIGREPDGEFARPESAPDIDPAPIARNTRSGEFADDPFDFVAGDLGFGGGVSAGREDAMSDAVRETFADMGDDGGGGGMGVSLTSEDRSVLEDLALSNMASGDRAEKIEEVRLSEDPSPEAREAVVETGESILNFRDEIEDPKRTDTDFFTSDDLDSIDSLMSKFRGGR